MFVSLMLIIIILSAMGDKIDHNSYSYWCNLSGYSAVVAKFGTEKHLLCLRMVPMGASQLTRVSRVYLDPDLDERINKAFSLGDVTMASGFPLVAPSTGSAEGYIGEDGQFYGVLHLGNRTLYADPYNKDDPRRAFGPFEDGSFVNPARPRREYPQRRNAYDSKRYPPETEDSPPPAGTAQARICDLLLLADKEFFVKDAQASLNHAVSRMVHAVAQADVIFRNADFDEDGMPDNIGFSVKYILVLASDDTNTRVFGDIRYSSAVDGRSYLMRFSRLRRLSEVCLGIAFSGHSFQNRTLGLSFTSLGGGLGGAAGGLCDRRAFGRSFNTLAIAHATGNGDERVPERIASLTLAHEIGHSFGAHHDDNFPNSLCRGYLMGAQSSTADNPSHFEFSLCSKRLIAATLNTMSYCLYDEMRPYCGNSKSLCRGQLMGAQSSTAHNPSHLKFSLCSKRLIAATLNTMSYCLYDEMRPYCGNSIVEEDEACDCGLPVRCVYSDPCCTPRTGGAEHFEEGYEQNVLKCPEYTRTLHKGGCAVAPTSTCHPSQGPCCTLDCHHANLTESGIDCTRLGQECSCADPACHCGLGGRCYRDGSCHAAECAAQGLRECQCTRQGLGGRLQEARMCGACCAVPGAPERCVAAEVAALVRREIGRVKWLRDDYEGPNLTIKLCAECPPTMIRAWPVGGPCVTQNVVGVCSPRGVCVAARRPMFNVYPNTQNVAMLRQRHSSTTRIRMSTSLIAFVSVFMIVK